MKIQPRWISRSFLVLACAIMASGPATAEEPKRGTESVDKGELRARLFSAFYDVFFKQLRATAILAACDHAALAATLEPAVEERLTVLFQALNRMRADPQTAAAVQKLSSDDAAALLRAVDQEMEGYITGFQDAVKVFRPDIPNVCENALKLADIVLKEKEAATGK